LDDLVLSKIADLQRQVTNTKDELSEVKASTAQNTWEINDIKAQLFDIKTAITDIEDKLRE